VRKVLIQLDTDQHPSTFDAMVAFDSEVPDELLRYGGIEPDVVQGLVQSAYFTRPPGDANLAVWVGGSSVGAGEEVLEAVKKSFFGPFHVSVMLDSNGCNTTACTTVARLAAEMDLKGRRAVIVGAGAVGLRAAKLLIDEGCDVTVSGIPKDRFEGKEYRRARGLKAAEERGMQIAEPEHDLVRAMGEQRVDQRRRVRADRLRGEAGLEQRAAAVKGADLEGDRPGVDARDARTAPRAQTRSSLAIS